MRPTLITTLFKITTHLSSLPCSTFTPISWDHTINLLSVKVIDSLPPLRNKSQRQKGVLCFIHWYIPGRCSNIFLLSKTIIWFNPSNFTDEETPKRLEARLCKEKTQEQGLCLQVQCHFYLAHYLPDLWTLQKNQNRLYFPHRRLYLWNLLALQMLLCLWHRNALKDSGSLNQNTKCWQMNRRRQLIWKSYPRALTEGLLL